MNKSTMMTTPTWLLNYATCKDTKLSYFTFSDVF